MATTSGCAFECRTVDALMVHHRRRPGPDRGRRGTLPDGRGNGAPLASLIELPSGSKIAHVLAGPAEQVACCWPAATATALCAALAT
jgi:hypothetical protein